MGLAASQGRFLSLTSRKTDLEYQGQQVNQQRTALGSESANLFESLVNLRPPTPPSPLNNPDYDAQYQQYLLDRDSYETEYQRINSLTENIQVQDRTLELLLKNIDTQHQAVQTEMDAVKKVIDKNIESTFKTFS